MAEPLIAVIGSVLPDRAKEIGLKKPDEGQQTAENIGRALARQGCRIVAYSSAPLSVEHLVVSGYIDECISNPALKEFAQVPQRIEVPFPREDEQPDFLGKDKVGENFFWYRRDRNPNWASSFYRSLTRIDGAILIGGSYTTYIAGTVAMSHGKPIAPIATYGGHAAKLWQELSSEPGILEEDDIGLLAPQSWEPRTVDKLVTSLLQQQQRIADQRRETEQKTADQRREAEQRIADQRRDKEKADQERSGQYHVYVAVVLLVLSLGIMPFTWDNASLTAPVLLSLLLLGPLFAGVSGATARTAFEMIGGALPSVPLNLARTAGLGAIAGVIAGTLFVIAQLVTMSPEIKPEIWSKQVGRLVPLAVLTGFIGGLTLDAVFRKLLGTNVVTDELLRTLLERAGSRPSR